MLTQQPRSADRELQSFPVDLADEIGIKPQSGISVDARPQVPGDSVGRAFGTHCFAGGEGKREGIRSGSGGNSFNRSVCSMK